MAIAFDTSTQKNEGSSVSSITFSHTCTGSDLVLLVACMAGGNVGDAITGVTYNGVAMTQLVKKGNGAANQFVYIYGLVAPATGANDVVVSQSDSSDMVAAAASYTGALQSGLPDATTSGAVTGNLTLSTTTVADNSWVFTAARNVNEGSPTAGTNITLRQDVVQISAGDSNAAVTPAGSFSQTWTVASGETFGCSASFAPSLAAAFIPKIIMS